MRRRQARCGSRIAASSAAPGGGGRRLLAALLREERHDRVLRAAGVGAVRRRGRRDRRPRWGAGRAARRASGDGPPRRSPARSVTTRCSRCTHPERDLHARLDGNAVGLAALDRLEAAARRGRGRLTGCTAARTRSTRGLEQLAGRPAVRDAGDSGGGGPSPTSTRVRDLDLKLGPAVWTSSDHAARDPRGVALVVRAHVCSRRRRASRTAAGRDGPIGHLLVEFATVAWDLHAQMADEQRELQRRWASVVDGDVAAGPSVPGRVRRPRAGLALVGLPLGRHADRRRRRRRRAPRRVLLVLGDFHGGGNPLVQGLFAHRHPQPARSPRAS